ncbi:MAG: outer membrane beta-barrel protein [Ferruginibacter sp.]
MKKLFTMILLSGSTLLSFAQNAGKISGNIQDGGNQKIIDAATISLLHAGDSSLLKTALADKEGHYAFENVPAGNYLVMATSTGHSKVYSAPVTVEATTADAKVAMLQLIPVTKSLEAVVVTSKKQFVERKLDKTIINPDALISNTGTTALEVLEKSPGITVDKDGNISLRGKQGVLVMIDGKPTYMSNQEVVNFLKAMPSSSIEQIELMTNPSAKYDAAGNAGIINLKTKKIKQRGFNGNLSTAYGQGFYPKTNNSLNLNYRTGKLNIFSTLNGNYRRHYQDLSIQRIYLNPDESVRAIFRQGTFMRKVREYYSSKIGMDYEFSPKTTIGFVATGYTAPGSENIINTSYLSNSFGAIDSIVTALNQEKSRWGSSTLNLNFRHQFDSTGRELTADVDYVNYTMNKNQYFYNNSYHADWSKKSHDELAGSLGSGIDIYSGKMDYTQQLPHKIKLEAGLKSSFVKTKNDADYFNVIQGNKEIDYEKSNNFIYEENINAAYVNFSKEIKKWGFQAGLRVENTAYSGKQFGNPQRTDSSFTNGYTNAFPTAYVSYNASEKHNWSFSYGRRISRADYEDLNPFLSFLDKYTYEAGNPFLRPTFSHIFEVGHSYNKFLNTSLKYSHDVDLSTTTFEQKDFATILRPGNFGKRDNVNLSVNARMNPKKWWTIMVNTSGDYNHFAGRLYGEDLDIKAATWLAYMNNQFNFKKGWAAELSGFYRSRGIEGQIIINSMYNLNAGISKQVLKNKGTLKLALRDFTGPMKTAGTVNFQNTRASFNQVNDNKVATISFNYRFGKPIKGMKKRNTGGASDEQNRLKSAN